MEMISDDCGHSRLDYIKSDSSSPDKVMIEELKKKKWSLLVRLFFCILK